MKYKTDAPSGKPIVGAVIVCAGKGERCGLSYNKILHRIGQKTVVEQVIDVFDMPEIDRITVVASAHDINSIAELLTDHSKVGFTEGGSTRTESVYKGLIATPCDIVVIHDGARPYVTRDIILRSVKSAKTFGSGIAAVHSVDTVKRIGTDGKVYALPRSELYNIQTPQAFGYGEIVEAYEKATGTFTDDSEVYQNAGYSPVLTEGSYGNIKITTPGDLLGVPETCKIGIGFDVHRLVPGRSLILGGIKIEHNKGLLGHSDADVLTHAVMDAMLSAAGCPDIGVLFPDSDDRYLGITSVKLLEQVDEKIKDLGFGIINISAVIAAQEPKLAPHISAIRGNIASVLGIDISRINVSATTTEQLGTIGNGKGMAATASCILSENSK